MDDTQRFADGFAFYKGGGHNANLIPPEGEDHSEWIKGFCCAMADYDPERIDPSIQAALLHRGICSDLLEDMLQAAEAVMAGEEWCRWPAVPVRGWGRLTGTPVPGDAAAVAAWPDDPDDIEGGPQGPGAVIVSGGDEMG